MDDIAVGAQATKPTLYAHFGSKEALYREALAREARSLEQHLFTAYNEGAGQPMTTQVRRGTLALFDYARKNPDGFRLIFGEQSAGPATQTRTQLTTSVRDRVAQLIRAGAPSGQTLGPSAEILSAILVTGIIAAAEQATSINPTDTHAAAELTTSACQAAIRGLDPHWLTGVDEAHQAE
jgi:AcrR family transcriptional regulator